MENNINVKPTILFKVDDKGVYIEIDVYNKRDLENTFIRKFIKDSLEKGITLNQISKDSDSDLVCSTYNIRINK